MKILYSERLHEDVDSLFRSGIVLQVDDSIMYQFMDEVHVDLNVSVPLLLYGIFAKLQCTMIVTLNDSQMMKEDTKFS